MSFYHAGVGIVSGLQERNMRVHALATLVVLVAGLGLGLSRTEWLTVLILIALVTAAELVNTAVEEICNILRDDLGMSYAATKRARDTAAGAVLITAVVAGIIGIWIFGPKILG